MKLKNTVILIAIFITAFFSAADAASKRPCELRFYVNSHLNTVTSIEYNSKGDVIKMSSYENSKLADYARYRYTSDRKLYAERTYSASGILLRTRYYSYDADGLITGEKVYSPDGELIEYLTITYSSRKIRKIEYFRPDKNPYQTIEFRYNNNILEAMAFVKTGKFIMIMKAVYDNDMLLTGHNIIHSNADVKIRTEYIYEEGYAAEESLQLIFR